MLKKLALAATVFSPLVIGGCTQPCDIVTDTVGTRSELGNVSGPMVGQTTVDKRCHYNLPGNPSYLGLPRVYSPG